MFWPTDSVVQCDDQRIQCCLAPAVLKVTHTTSSQCLKVSRETTGNAKVVIGLYLACLENYVMIDIELRSPSSQMVGMHFN